MECFPCPDGCTSYHQWQADLRTPINWTDVYNVLDRFASWRLMYPRLICGSLSSAESTAETAFRLFQASAILRCSRSWLAQTARCACSICSSNPHPCTQCVQCMQCCQLKRLGYGNWFQWLHVYIWNLFSWYDVRLPSDALTLLVGRQEGHQACKKLNGGWDVGVVVWDEVQTCI